MRMLIPFVLALLAVAPADAQRIAGDWQGVLKAGPQELRVVLRVTGDTASGLAATFDSVDQGAMGLPVANIALTRSTLRFTLPQVGGSFEGMLDEARTAVRGTWTQGGATFPLELMRGPDNAMEPARVPWPGELDGRWSGTVAAAGTPAVRVIVHVATYEDGLGGTMDVPDQGARGLRVTRLVRRGDRIRLEIRQVGGMFEGTLNAEHNSITGTWRQGGAETPLVLRNDAAGAR